MTLPPSSMTAMELVKFSSRALASAAFPISLAAASVNDFFVPSCAMSPLLLECGRRAQRDHVQCVFRGLNRRGKLIAVHAAGLHAAFPLDGRLHQRVRLAAGRNPDFVIQE